MNRIFKLTLGCFLSLIVFFTFTGTVYGSGVHEYSMWLKQGETFQLDQYLSVDESMTAGCNEDCFDVDLTLMDATTKTTVFKDVADNTSPKITAPYDGNFVIELTLPNCALTRGCKVWLDTVEEK